MKPHWRTRILIGIACLLTFAAGASAAEARAFSAKSLAELRKAHEGQPFIVAFWSITCEPCREELKSLVDWHRKFPKIPIVLVAADPPKDRAAVEHFLKAFDLAGIATWQFADDDVERVRYSVDRTWQGELPRSYFFTAKHEVTPQTGVPDTSWTQAWLTRESAPPKQ